MAGYEIEETKTVTVIDNNGNTLVTIERYITDREEEEINFDMNETIYNLEDARVLAEALNKLLVGEKV